MVEDRRRSHRALHMEPATRGPLAASSPTAAHPRRSPTAESVTPPIGGGSIGLLGAARPRTRQVCLVVEVGACWVAHRVDVGDPAVLDDGADYGVRLVVEHDPDRRDPLSVRGSSSAVGNASAARARSRATLVAPDTGRWRAGTRPPVSDTRTTSGATTSRNAAGAHGEDAADAPRAGGTGRRRRPSTPCPGHQEHPAGSRLLILSAGTCRAQRRAERAAAAPPLRTRRRPYKIDRRVPKWVERPTRRLAYLRRTRTHSVRGQARRHEGWWENDIRA